MKFSNLLLLFPIAVLSIGLTLGCGGRDDNVVIEAPETPELEEEAYEAESYGSLDDESQN
jgi:hypothetical protein